jgi:type II secretory pathway pseudopilin PulG
MKRSVGHKGFSLIGLLLSTAIVALLCYFAMKTYMGGGTTDKETQKALAEQGISTTSYPAMVNQAQQAVDKYNKTTREHEQESRQSVE